MIVTGEHTFPGARETVWSLLQDPDVLAKAMPGAKRLTITGDGKYEGVVRIGVGPVTAAEWRLTVELHDRVEPSSYVMHVDTKGPLGFTRGTATVALVEVDDGTRMLYHADLSVGGKVASVGQRLLDQVAKMLTKQGLNALNREMESRLAGGPAPAPRAVEIRGEMPDDALPDPAYGSGASADDGAADGRSSVADDAAPGDGGGARAADAGDARPEAGGGAR